MQCLSMIVITASFVVLPSFVLPFLVRKLPSAYVYGMIVPCHLPKAHPQLYACAPSNWCIKTTKLFSHNNGKWPAELNVIHHSLMASVLEVIIASATTPVLSSNTDHMAVSR